MCISGQVRSMCPADSPRAAVGPFYHMPFLPLQPGHPLVYWQVRALPWSLRKYNREERASESQPQPTGPSQGSSLWKQTDVQPSLTRQCADRHWFISGQGCGRAVMAGESKWEPTRDSRPRRQTNSQRSIGLICRQARHQTRVGRLPVWSIYHEGWDAVGLLRDQVCISKMPWEVVPSLPTRSLKVCNSSEPAQQSLHKGSWALPEAQLSDMGHLLTPPTGHPVSCSTTCLRLADHSPRKSDRNQRLISHPHLYRVHFSKADLPRRHKKQYFQGTLNTL